MTDQTMPAVPQIANEWITVAEAAVLVDRHVPQIYRWIDDGRLSTRTSTEGVTRQHPGPGYGPVLVGHDREPSVAGKGRLIRS
ncbi:hypothetical protein [Microbacterium murale]|uniref:Helix-turn-helix domain-containing protein n=1 Tax=Microbacterium murale TaxID=1081040 RepID=A0ABU0P4X4_9MICO|nr:hypothetical protein [Microbacterium murale]MDQ0642374.1 hypothetical protein [Microbacterium murale]